MALAANLSQNISETEVAPDALVQKCSLFMHVLMVHSYPKTFVIQILIGFIAYAISQSIHCNLFTVKYSSFHVTMHS